MNSKPVIPALDRCFEVLDEGEEDVHVDGFGDERHVADREGAFSIFLTGIPGDGYRRDLSESRDEAQLFEELISVCFRHSDI